MAEAVRAFKERVMSTDPSVREKAKDPGFAAKWDVAVRWQLAHGPTAAPAGAEVSKVPVPVLASQLTTRNASPDSKARPSPPFAAPVPTTPSVRRQCVHGMEAIDCAPCSRSRFLAPIKPLDKPSRSSDSPMRRPADQVSNPALSLGDAVRHRQHGIGVVSTSDATELVVHFYPKGWARLARTQLELLERREPFLAMLDGTWHLGPSRLKAAVIYLRLDDASLYRPAALHFALCPEAESKELFASYLGLVPLSRAQKVRARVREARGEDHDWRDEVDWRPRESNRRGDVANQKRLEVRAVKRRAPDESADAHLLRVDRNLAEIGARPLSAAQRGRMLQGYLSWCWNCRAEVSSKYSIPCAACLWFVCVQCRRCSPSCNANL